MILCAFAVCVAYMLSIHLFPYTVYTQVLFACMNVLKSENHTQKAFILVSLKSVAAVCLFVCGNLTGCITVIMTYDLILSNNWQICFKLPIFHVSLGKGYTLFEPSVGLYI